jgi:YgiT-type zinc finger domain-containing protein
MICLICRQAEIVEKFTSVKFERSEFRLVVSGVPARVCPSCEEAYVDEETAAQLLREADDLFQTGMREQEIEYHSHHLNHGFP